MGTASCDGKLPLSSQSFSRNSTTMNVSRYFVVSRRVRLTLELSVSGLMKVWLVIYDGTFFWVAPF